MFDQTPVRVVVGSDRYDIIDEPTPRNLKLAKMLMDMGGINETVEPGEYYFNVVFKRPFKWIVSLEKI